MFDNPFLVSFQLLLAETEMLALRRISEKLVASS